MYIKIQKKRCEFKKILFSTFIKDFEKIIINLKLK